MKGRKPKPTALRLIQGNREHRPINRSEPKPKKKAPPKGPYSTKDERKARRYLIRELEGMGTLASSDQAFITAYCHHWAIWAEARRQVNEYIQQMDGKIPLVIKTKKENLILNPLIGVANRAMDGLMKAAAELGLNPVQRTRIKAKNAEEEDKLQKFLAR